VGDGNERWNQRRTDGNTRREEQSMWGPTRDLMHLGEGGGLICVTFWQLGPGATRVGQHGVGTRDPGKRPGCAQASGGSDTENRRAHDRPDAR
jgi:hypothetical protein